MSYPKITRIQQNTLDYIDSQLSKARDKFPNGDFMYLATMEEVGEFSQALMNYQLDKSEENEQQVLKEAYQAIAMLIRFIEEGDNELFPNN